MSEKTVMVTYSDIPLEFDTLSAVKVRHYKSDNEQIYCYARFYCLKGALAVGVKIFERADIAQSLITLRTVNDDQVGGVEIEFGYLKSPKAVMLDSSEQKDIAAPNVNYLSGDDNQGFYWGAEFIVSQELLAQAGIELQEGKLFLANLFISTKQGGVGSAFRGDYGNFLVVPY